MNDLDEGFSCVCAHGYALLEDGQSCKGTYSDFNTQGLYNHPLLL